MSANVERIECEAGDLCEIGLFIPCAEVGRHVFEGDRLCSRHMEMVRGLTVEAVAVSGLGLEGSVR